MPNTPLLPYPAQLPQDSYAKNFPVSTPSVPISPEVPVVTPTPPSSGGAVSSGGVYYGSTPPANPQYGWLWTRGYGYLYVYMEPGVWSQVGTNW